MQQAISISALVCYVLSGAGVVSLTLLIGFLWVFVHQRKRFQQTVDDLKQKLDLEKQNTEQRVKEQAKANQNIIDQLTSDKNAAEEKYRKMANREGFFVDRSVFDSLHEGQKRIELSLFSTVLPALKTCEEQLKTEYQHDLEAELREKDRERHVQVEAERQNVRAATAETKRLKELLESVSKRLEKECANSQAIASENEAYRKRLESSSDLYAKIDGLEAELRAKTDDLANFEWLRAPIANWRESYLKLCEKFGTGEYDWFTTEFQGGVLQSLMSMQFPIGTNREGKTINGTPDEIVMRVDEAFYAHLHDDALLASLEEARTLYFGRFNELFAGRYEIRWPKRGETFDESYCRLDRDNGFTEVRVAVACAIFENGELKRRARVETVARA